MYCQTFSVDNIEPINQKFGHKMSAKNETTRWINDCSFTFELWVNGASRVYEAYCKHYRLELSVNYFWLAIAHGVSIHIHRQMEKYQSKCR